MVNNIDADTKTFTSMYVGDKDFLSKVQKLDDSAVFSDRILGRGAHVLLASAALITTALDTIVFLGASLGAICTLGTKKSFVDKMLLLDQEMAKILVEPYKHLLMAINPDTDYKRDRGIFYKYTAPLFTSTGTLVMSKIFLERHVASRLSIALLVVSLIITRVVDLAIGVIAAPLSLLMLGKIEVINTLAINGLSGTGLIFDIAILSLALLNPQSLLRNNK